MIKSSLFISRKIPQCVILALLFSILSSCDSGYPTEESGQPVPAQASAKLVAELPNPAPVKAESVDVLLDGLRSRLEAEPDDVEGWVLLAKSYQYLGRAEESQQAFAMARKLGYTGADIDATSSGSSQSRPPPRKEFNHSSSFSRQPVYQLMEEVLDEKAVPGEQ